jgi:endo-1,4-beta-xylanase
MKAYCIGSIIWPLLIGLLMTGLVTSCTSGRTGTYSQPTLKEAFKGDFLIGVAVNQAQFTGKDARGAALVEAQFNSITPENVLKWESVHPRPDKYEFTAPDRYVEFGEKNGMFIIGHTLVWHKQTPQWVFEDDKGNPVDRETLLQRMREHIHTVVGRYKGRIKAWDVVNEAINEDGSWRETQWYKIIGEDFVAKAFQYAHEADPNADLNYNEFALETEPKRNGVIALIKKLKAQGVPITGIGSQMHARMDWPTVAETDAAFDALAKLGLKVMVTELDMDVLPSAGQYKNTDTAIGRLSPVLQARLNPYTNGLPDSVQQQLAKRYADLFGAFLKHRREISRVTFWCVTDADSWLNYWPVKGRTAYPLLFDGNGQPKPAFDAVIRTVR